MWHKPCRTFHLWCLCIKTRCLFIYLITLSHQQHEPWCPQRPLNLITHSLSFINDSLHKIVINKKKLKVYMSYFVVSSVSADGLALFSTRLSASTAAGAWYNIIFIVRISNIIVRKKDYLTIVISGVFSIKIVLFGSLTFPVYHWKCQVLCRFLSVDCWGSCSGQGGWENKQSVSSYPL